MDRKTFIVKQEEGFVVNRVITQGEVSLNRIITQGEVSLNRVITQGEVSVILSGNVVTCIIFLNLFLIDQEMFQQYFR